MTSMSHVFLTPNFKIDGNMQKIQDTKRIQDMKFVQYKRGATEYPDANGKEYSEYSFTIGASPKLKVTTYRKQKEKEI